MAASVNLQTFAPNLWFIMFENKETTNIDELGEFRLIKHLTSAITLETDQTLVGAGDDAAVIDPKSKKAVVEE